MKNLNLKALLLLATGFLTLATTAQADPGGPIVPWPASASPAKMYVEDIQGDWYGFGENDNTLWLIRMTPAPEDHQKLLVTIDSNGLFTSKVSGAGSITKNIFWSLMQINSNHSVGIVIYRDGNHFVMRISRDKPDVEEIQIFRSRSNK